MEDKIEKDRELPEEIKIDLKSVVDHTEQEDNEVRERQIREARKLKLYWSGFQHVWYDEVAHDWKVADAGSTEDSDGSYYDKPVNIFRAYLESIIAALSITIPAIICLPEDADNPLDVSTAKAGDKIAKKVYKENESPLLWLHALYIFCTEGMVACHNYSHEDEKYGSYQEKKYETKEEEHFFCKSCEQPIDDDVIDSSFDDDDIPIKPLVCPECQAPFDIEDGKTKGKVERLIGTETKSKTGQCLDVYGLLYVKVPNYARKQKDCPYLTLAYETHYVNVIEKYKHVKDELKQKIKQSSSSSASDQYEKWGRLSPQYYGDEPNNVVTLRTTWLRPCAFNVLQEEKCEELKRRFPDGCKVVFVNDVFCEAIAEELDKHWTLTYNPLSDYIHFDPIGLLLVSVQDILNDLISLTLQTIEQGIPQTWADPAVVNFDAYRQSESTPGSLYPTKPVPSNKNISESFTTLKTAQLSSEVLPFSEKVQQLGQLSSGALPALFGGMAEAGSKTAAEYSMSRSQALQRLQNPWKVLLFWWKNIFAKVIDSYIEDAVGDEKFTERNKDGGYVSVVIKKIELQGKIGDVDVNADENLPLTIQQKKDMFIQIMQFANPIFQQALLTPENLPFLREIIGMPEFKIPGEEFRIKQQEEIRELLLSEPIDMGSGMDLMSSVQVDPVLDNHQVEADVCKSWLVSEEGRLAKTENAPGYLNVLQHFKIHMGFLMQQQMQQQMAAQAPNATGEETAPKEEVAQGE